MEQFGVEDYENILCFDDIENMENIIYEEEKSVSRRFNYCDDCDAPCDIVSEVEYCCTNCGKSKTIIGEIYEENKESGGGVKMVKLSTRNIYSGAQDYSKVQKNNIWKQLQTLNMNAAERNNSIPSEILKSTVNMYNEIQNVLVDYYDKSGEIQGQKKFVKRGAIKDEVLAACLYYQLLAHRTPWTRKNVAEWMSLKTEGLSKGENIVNDLQSRNKISLPCVETDPIEDYIERYLTTLGLYKEGPTEEEKRAKGFVLDLYNTAFEYKVCMDLFALSKVVGSIYVYVQKMRINISAENIETSCETIKKSTFMKFVKQIEDHIRLFVGVFEKHNVPHGITGKIRKYKRDVLEDYELLD